ncbi:ENR1 protein, partial [Steatornis caripensis]|nr:ENR1 protein [Steatornis caripensis]
ELRLPSIGKNLFVDLAKEVSGELNITNCWVCGGLLMSEEWPWKGTSLDLLQILKWNHSVTSEENKRPLGWALTSEVVSAVSIEHIG